MATKTISIDTEAYSRLKARKVEGESFSEAIKRLVPKPFNFRQWLDSLEAHPVSEEFVAVIENTIAQRRSPKNMEDFNDLPRHHRAGRSAPVKTKPASSRGENKGKRNLANR